MTKRQWLILQSILEGLHTDNMCTPFWDRQANGPLPSTKEMKDAIASLDPQGYYEDELPTPYRVTWQYDSEASTPLEAAREALEAMRDSTSIANVFEVVDRSGKRVEINLEKERM